MPLEIRALQVAKEADRPAECQDAWSADPQRGVAAVADGVTAAIFSGPWARMLVERIVADAPDPGGDWDWTAWLAPLRQRWWESIDRDALPWFQRAKMPQGAFATAVWIEVEPAEGPPAGVYRCRAFAVGDSCLLQVREGRLLWSFPLEKSAQFTSLPSALGSIDLGRDRRIELAALQTTVQADDWLILATDAVAAWALESYEQGRPPDWSRYWDLSAADWRDEVVGRRADGSLRYDDATLVLARPAAVGRLIEPSAVAAVPELTADEGGPPRASAGAADPLRRAETPAAAEAPAVERWTENIVSMSEKVAGRVADEVVRGWRRMKEALRKPSAEEPGEGVAGSPDADER